MKNPEANKRKAGFYLLEVLVASVAAAVGLVGVLVSFSVLTRTARLLDTRTKVLHQARQQMEQLQRIPFAASELSLGTHMIAGGAYYVSNFPPASTEGRAKLVTVSLSAQAANNATSQVAVTTVLSMTLHK